MGDLDRDAAQLVAHLKSGLRSGVLDEDLARRHARAILDRPLAGMSIGRHHDALRHATVSAAATATPVGDPRAAPHLDESDLRRHLGRVAAHLDTLRPWPQPVVHAQPRQRWADYTDARVVARCPLDAFTIMERVGYTPYRENHDGTDIRVLILHLGSGPELALAGRWWPGSLDTAVLTRDPQITPDALIRALTATKLFTTDDFTALPEPTPKPLA